MKMESFIFVNLMGGMGNQLFQYAAGLLKQQVTNGTLLLCKPHTNIHDTQDYRDILFKNENKYDGEIPPHVTLYQEDGFAPWNPETWKCDFLLLYGYFQHYSSLKPILPKFKESILECLYEKRMIMKQKYNVVIPSMFIHIRRGDYLNIKEVNHLESLEYYKNAYNLLAKNKVYVFSDDIEWCKSQEFFKQINPTYVDEQDPVNALALMCEIKDGAIIANSTFSWMGAYLGCGLKPNVVYYPTKWFEGKKPDLFPEEWIRM